MKYTTAITLCSTIIPKLRPLICCNTSLAAGILLPLNRKSISEVQRWCLANSQFCSAPSQMALDGVEVGQVVSAIENISLRSFVQRDIVVFKTGKGQTETVETKLETHYCLKYHYMLYDFPSLEPRDPEATMKNSLRRKNYTGQCPHTFGRIVYHLGEQTQCSCCRAPLYLPLCLRPNSGNHQTPRLAADVFSRWQVSPRRS